MSTPRRVRRKGQKVTIDKNKIKNRIGEKKRRNEERILGSEVLHERRIVDRRIKKKKNK